MKKTALIVLGIAIVVLMAFNRNLKEEPLKLPAGFRAEMFAEEVGLARHLAVTQQGNVYVKLSKLVNGSGIVLLQDLDKDGKA